MSWKYSFETTPQLDLELSAGSPDVTAPSSSIATLLEEPDSKNTISSSPLLVTHDLYAFEFDFDLWEVRGLGSPSDSDLSKFAELGLTARDVEWLTRFVGDPFMYTTRLVGTENGKAASWRYPTRRKGDRAEDWGKPLAYWHLLRHLKGIWWIATAARKSTATGRRSYHTTWSFAIDLDNRSNGDFDRERVDLHDRYHRAVEILGPPSLVFRSSASGGLHLYYLLTAPVDLFRLCTFDRADKMAKTGRGAIERLLNAGGLPSTPGRVEFYPTVTLRNAPKGNRLRLPFGRGSQLLSPDTLAPIVGGTPLDDLRWVSAQLDAGHVRLHRFDDFFEKAAALPQETRKTARRTRQDRVSRDGKTPKGWTTGRTTEWLWENGLPGPKSREAVVSQLFFACRSDGMSIAQTERLIVELLREKHNGYSSDFDQSLETGERAVRRQIDALAKNHRPRARSTVALPGNTAEEVLSIIAATSSAVVCSDRNGEPVKNFVVQRLLFQSLQWHKQYVISLMIDALDELRRDRSELSPDNDQFVHEWMRLVTTTNPELDPDWDQQSFVVPWSDKKRSALTGMTGDSRSRYWFAARKAGLHEEITPSSWLDRTAATYRVRLDLLTPETFGDFAFAVNSLMSPKQRRATYSRRYADKVASTDMDQPTALANPELLRLMVRAHQLTVAITRAA